MEEDKVILDNVVLKVEVTPKVESNNTSEVVRLTPTGKISHAKTRVYTQRYRKEWEHMTDFQDWLTSVPYQATRAFCKFCQRNLHAHRLSLLKHMCTLKHQRAAIQYNKIQAVSGQQIEEISNDMNYVVERLEVDDYENTNYEDATFIQEVEDEVEEEDDVIIENHAQEEIIEETEIEVESPIKKIRLQKEDTQDTLAQAMSHVQSDYLTESSESIELQMVDESNQDNDEEETKYELLKYENLQNSKNQFEIHKDLTIENIKHSEDEVENPSNSNDEEIKTAISSLDSKDAVLSSDNSKKVYVFSSGGKSYTLVKSKLPQLVLNQFNKNFTLLKTAKREVKNNKDVTAEMNTIEASTSQESTDKNILTVSPSLITTKSVLFKKPIVSTHVLETSKGVPVSGLQVSLYKLQDGRWTFVHESITTANGNCNNFFNTTKDNVSTGRYKLHYDVEKYYSMRKISTIYPFIEIVFDIKDPNSSYHIPLLLSPYSYSTYKDSRR